MPKYSMGSSQSLPYEWKRDPQIALAAATHGLRFRSRPSAPHSARDAVMGVDYNPDTGFSSDALDPKTGLPAEGSWNRFFRASRLRSGLDTAAAPDPNAAQPQAPSAVPDLTSAELGTAPTPTPAAPLTPPSTPSSRYQSVIDANLQYFSRKGVPISRPSAAAPTQYGTSFVSRFGTGSVRSAADVEAEKRRFSGADVRDRYSMSLTGLY